MMVPDTSYAAGPLLESSFAARSVIPWASTRPSVMPPVMGTGSRRGCRGEQVLPQVDRDGAQRVGERLK
jgi:hypothetical protein